MARPKSSAEFKPRPDHWHSFDTAIVIIKGKEEVLTPGTVCGISGEPGGRFRFQRKVVNTKTEAIWLDFVGGTEQGTDRAVIMCRSFRPERVTRIYKQRPARGKP